MEKIRHFLPLCMRNFKSNYRTNSHQLRTFASQKSNIDIDLDENKPIKYSTSKASKYKARATRTGIEQERLWYEPYVIMVSITVFMVYFCVLREENDIDKELNRSLYSRIEGLEETQLRLCLKYNLDHGLATEDIVKRLNEIEEEKQRHKSIAAE